MFQKGKQRQINQENLAIILDLFTKNPFMSRLLFKELDKQDGFYPESNKELAMCDCASFKTNYGTINYSIVVNGDVTAINTCEQKIYSDKLINKHFILRTNDCIWQLSRL